MVSATALPPDKTFLLGAMALAAATVLASSTSRCPGLPARTLPPLHYVAGVWVALVCALLFMGFYALRVAEEARQLADALAATELVLAARTAPFGARRPRRGRRARTRHAARHDRARRARAGKRLADDAARRGHRLLRTQSERCREILSKLTSLSTAPEEHLGRCRSRTPRGGHGPAPRFRRRDHDRREWRRTRAGRCAQSRMLYGLGNLVENAVDFASPRCASRPPGRPQRCRSPSPTTVRASRPKCSTGSASPMSPRAPPPARRRSRRRPRARHVHRQDAAEALRRQLAMTNRKPPEPARWYASLAARPVRARRR